MERYIFYKQKFLFMFKIIPKQTNPMIQQYIIYKNL